MRKVSMRQVPLATKLFDKQTSSKAVHPRRDDTSKQGSNRDASSVRSTFDEHQSSQRSGPQYLDHSQIQERAIQILHADYSGQNMDEAGPRLPWYRQILHPNNQFRRTFDAITVVWVLALVAIIPFQIGFDWYAEPKWQKYIQDLLDAWFIVDIILNFRTGYIHHGTVVMEPEKIVSHYMATWFFIDLLGALPFERFIRAEAKSRKSIKLVKYFKIPKLLRISRVMKYVRDHKYVYDIAQVFMLVFTLLHVGACIWMLALDPCDEYDVESYAGAEVCAQGNIYYLYVESFHISAVMMLGISNFHIAGSPDLLDMFIQKHDGDKVRMYIISTLYMVGGLFVIALLMSEMNVYLMAKMQGSAAFQRLTDRVKHEMEYYGVPDDLQRQVRAFYDYVWIHQKQYDDKIALLSDQQMSTDLQRKLALHLFKDVVSHISFFSEVDDLLLGEICMSLRTRIFLPNDMILFKGDIGKELFIIAKGIVEVLRDDLPRSQRYRTPPILLRNGSFFGEIALVMEVRRTCSVQARTICEVNVLQQQAFDAILRENPDFARRINELVVARQLESCLSRSAQKGLNFKVAKSDLERAVDVVEENMKMGLERRMVTGDGNLNTASNNGLSRIQVINRQEYGPPRPPPQSRDSSCFVGVPPANASSRPENNDAPVLQPSKEATKKESQRPGSRFSSASTASRVSDVSEMIRDITRRSTRFPDEKTVRMAPSEGVSCRNNEEEATPDDESDNSTAAHSDGDIDPPREQRKKWWRKRRRKQRGSHDGRMSSAGIAPWGIEDEYVAGHFHPGQMVDINSVRSSVLQSARLDEHQDDQMARLDVRLSAQDQMMKLLLDKLDDLEERERDKRQLGGNPCLGAGSPGGKEDREKHNNEPPIT